MVPRSRHGKGIPNRLPPCIFPLSERLQCELYQIELWEGGLAKKRILNSLGVSLWSSDWAAVDPIFQLNQAAVGVHYCAHGHENLE